MPNDHFEMIQMDTTKGALLKPEEQSGMQKMLSDAYEWGKENKTAIGVAAVGLATLSGMAIASKLVGRAVAGKSEQLASSPFNDLIEPRSPFANMLGEANPAARLLGDNTAMSSERGRLRFDQPGSLSDDYSLHQRYYGNDAGLPVIEHEVRHSAWLTNRVEMDSELNYFADGSPKVLQQMSLDPEHKHVFQIAEEINKQTGDWAQSLTAAFEKHQPRSLERVKYGLEQVGLSAAK